MTIDYALAKRLLDGAKEASEEAVALACRLYEGDAVRFVESPAGMPDDCCVYHLSSGVAKKAERILKRHHCALLSDELPKSNGVVIHKGHDDLRCHARPCGYDVCPVALAACFAACRAADATKDIPLYSEYVAKRRAASEHAEAFRAKWEPHLPESETALRLLLSDVENDFAGALVLSDDSFREEFLSDLERLLIELGKIDAVDNGHAMTSFHLTGFLENVDIPAFKFKVPDDVNLPARHLLVFDRVREFVNADLPIDYRYPYNEAARDFLVERLGKIVDDRYVLVVGTAEEIGSFCALNPCFLQTFDRNRLNLSPMGTADACKLYLSYLENDVRAQIADQEAFEADFRRFVGFNQDSLPFHGREMADYLAKYSNVLGRPELPRSRYQSSSLDEMLGQIVGLTQVKDTLRQLEQFALFRRAAQADGHELPQASLHMLFTGNPGTGKTMVAQIISTMLYKIGIIRRNKCHEVTAKDLIAKYVGQTDKQTHEHIEQALDGVLFIDEAYALTENASGTSFGTEAVAELVKSMDAYKDRLIVIFAGYEKEMADFLEVNPGLSSRIGYTFRFEDYSTDELVQIFDGAAGRAGFSADEDGHRELRELLAYYRRFKDFGNGRFVMEVLHRMIVKHANAMAAGTLPESQRYQLGEADVPSRQEMNDITDWAPQSAAEMLEPLVGIDTLKEKVLDLERVVSYYEQGRRHGLALPDLNMHMLFAGNPGTGKTTVARIVGKILYNVGAVASNKFIEVEANDLLRWDSEKGTTSVQSYLRDAMGGVLFIDEAYALMYSSSGPDAIAALVKAMEDHKGDFVVMFAGYQDEMRSFVAVNPGLASRIGFRFEFEDYDTDALQEIFDRKVAKAGLTVTDEAREATRAAFKYFHNVKDFGNGRFVDKLIQEVVARHAGHITGDNIALIDAEDVPSTTDLCKVVSMPVSMPSDVGAEEARRRIAVHEMGHATCSLALTGETNITLVTIEQEGFGALGYVEYGKNSGQPLPTAAYLRGRMCSLMGGIAAEELVLGSFSAGGSDDLRQATNLASRYVGRYGMSEVGFLQYVGEAAPTDARGNVDATKLPEEVRHAMNNLLKDAFEQAQETIAAHREAYDKMVDQLIEKGTISGEDITRTWKQLTGETHE